MKEHVFVIILLVAMLSFIAAVYHDGNLNGKIISKVGVAINNNASRTDVIKIISSECSNSSFWVESANECKQFIASKHFEFLELGK